MKTKKAYLCLSPLKIESQFPITFPKSMVNLLGVFTSKKEALKFGKEILEVTIQINK